MLVGNACIFVLQVWSIGYAALVDDRAKPVFPRWFGYLNLVLGVLLIPGAFVFLTKTGPFAWKVAPFIPHQLQPTLGFVDAAHLETYLAAAPPAAILTGGETSLLEQPLNDYARKHRYRLRRVSGLYLWVR